MTPRAVRIIVIALCVGGVAGMIATTIAGHNGAAMTFGIITAVAILCLMVATAVTAPKAAPRTGDVEIQAASVEAAIAALVDGGADERAVRDLVREAVSLGRQSPVPRPSP